MPRSRMRRARVRAAVVAAAVVASAACGNVRAPAPPSGAPNTSEYEVIPGIPMVLAPRGVRRLQELGFTTRRFGSDSLWAWRSVEQLAARARFVRGGGDSTRVLVEMWGPCQQERGCFRREAQLFLLSLGAGEEGLN